MRTSRLVAIGAGVVGALTIVAGCTSGSDGNGTPSAPPTTTVTATDTVSSTASTASTAGATPTAPTPPDGGSTVSGGTASGPGLCTPTVMRFVVGASDGAGGTSYFSIIATNASQQPCVTNGWPGVAIIGEDGSRQVAQATRSGAAGSTITVQPGQRIHAVLSSSDIPRGEDAGTCVPPHTTILFTLPDNTDSTRITGVKISLCDPRVQAFQAGVGG